MNVERKLCTWKVNQKGIFSTLFDKECYFYINQLFLSGNLHYGLNKVFKNIEGTFCEKRSVKEKKIG